MSVVEGWTKEEMEVLLAMETTEHQEEGKVLELFSFFLLERLEET